MRNKWAKTQTSASSCRIISNTVEERLSPGVSVHHVQLSVFNWVVDLDIGKFWVDFLLIAELVVLEHEGGLINNALVMFIVVVNQLQEELLVVKRYASLLAEIAPGDEVVSVDAVLVLDFWDKGTEVKDIALDVNLASLSRLVAINGDQGDVRVLESPESSKRAFLVASGHVHVKLALSHDAESEDILDALAGSSLIETLILAFQKVGHYLLIEK